MQAILTAEDLFKALSQVTPARIPLDKGDPDRWLWIGEPSQVSLRPDDGLYVSTHARLQWDVVGIKVPVTLRTVTISLSPAVEKIDGEEVLTFGLRIVQADLSAVPAFVENSIIGRVNEALGRPDARLSWQFLKTLDFSFLLPELLEPRRRMRLFARWGAVRIGEEGLTLAVGWGLDAEEASASAEPGVQVHTPAPPETTSTSDGEAAGSSVPETERPTLDSLNP